jgi:DNA-binding LytR/AlgR family response regulator
MDAMKLTGSIPQCADIEDADRRAERQVLNLPNQQTHERVILAFRRSSESLAGSQAEMPLLSRPRELWNHTRIAMKANGIIVFIDPAEIFAAEAQGNYVLVFHSKGSILLREQISTLANRLQAYGFIRIHRSILVNAAHVESIRPLFTGEYRLHISDGREYNVTRTYKRNLQALAEIWIGIEGFDPDSLIN